MFKILNYVPKNGFTLSMAASVLSSRFFLRHSFFLRLAIFLKFNYRTRRNELSSGNFKGRLAIANYKLA